MKQYLPKPGGIIRVEHLSSVTSINHYKVSEVYKTGEKKVPNKRGPKPQGYNIYMNGMFKEFLPYGDKSMWITKK